MISNKTELKRLSIRDDQIQSQDGLLYIIRAYSESNATNAIEKTISVLKIVFGLASETDDERIQSNAEYEALELHCKDLLPQWFLDVTPSMNVRPKNDTTWTVEGWIYWFLSFPSDRSWRWWGFQVMSYNEVEVYIQVEDLPFSWGALKWLLEVSGFKLVQLVE